MDGVRGNTHDVSIEREGDMNYVQSYYCPTSADQEAKERCTLRSDRAHRPAQERRGLLGQLDRAVGEDHR